APDRAAHRGAPHGTAHRRALDAAAQCRALDYTVARGPVHPLGESFPERPGRESSMAFARVNPRSRATCATPPALARPHTRYALQPIPGRPPALGRAAGGAWRFSFPSRPIGGGAA